jgi:hypothetical protein
MNVPTDHSNKTSQKMGSGLDVHGPVDVLKTIFQFLRPFFASFSLSSLVTPASLWVSFCFLSMSIRLTALLVALLAPALVAAITWNPKPTVAGTNLYFSLFGLKELGLHFVFRQRVSVRACVYRVGGPDRNDLRHRFKSSDYDYCSHW